MRRRPWLVRVTWPSKVLRFGFTTEARAKRYAEEVGERGAVAELLDSFTGELILKTGERLPFTFIPTTTYQVAGGRPGAIPGLGSFTPGVADFPAEWVAADGRIVLGGFVRFTGTQPGGTVVGGSKLIYRFTVTGADKASIDTGVDAPDAGDNDWTNGDILEMFLYSRTDEAAILSQLNLTLNNDGGANYDWIRTTTSNVTVSGNKLLAQTSYPVVTVGASAAANVFGGFEARVPDYLSTAGNKVLTGITVEPTQDTSIEQNLRGLGYRSTSALSRLALTPNTAGRKLKVGSQLSIYKRLAS